MNRRNFFRMVGCATAGIPFIQFAWQPSTEEPPAHLQVKLTYEDGSFRWTSGFRSSGGDLYIPQPDGGPLRSVEAFSNDGGWRRVVKLNLSKEE